MLIIREAQIKVLAEAQILRVRAEIVKSLWGMRSSFSPGLQEDDLDALVAFSIDKCRDRGFNQRETVHDFALSMLKDEELPMTAARMQQKALAIFREITTRSLFAKLEALAANLPPRQASPLVPAEPGRQRR